jgi:hypothetical protein
VVIGEKSGSARTLILFIASQVAYCPPLQAIFFDQWEAAMVKHLAAICFSLFIIMLFAGSRAAYSGDVTFTLSDQGVYSVQVKVFSQSRNWQWPSATTHYDLKDDGKHSIHISCQNGEKVCYGASYSANNKTYWGVGLKGDKPCAGCCLTCGSGVKHSWNLNDSSSHVCGSCGDGSCQCGPGTAKSLCAAHKGVDPNVGCTDFGAGQL